MWGVSGETKGEIETKSIFSEEQMVESYFDCGLEDRSERQEHFVDGGFFY